MKPVPKVDSVAAIKRLPIGTRLFLVRSLLGPSHPTERTIKQIRSADIVMTVTDPTSKNYGNDSYLYLRNVRVQAIENGFRIFEKESNLGEQTSTEVVCAEYVFELKPCHCLFKHPRSESEREIVKRALENARATNDKDAALIALAQLTGKCLSDQ